MTHPTKGQKTTREKVNTSKSRKDRILDYINKNHNKKFSIVDIFNQFSFNTDTGTIRGILEELYKEQLIESEIDTSPKGGNTLYFSKNAL